MFRARALGCRPTSSRWHSGFVPGEVTVHAKSTWLLAVFGGLFPLIAASAPVSGGLVRATWVLLWLGVLALLVVRVTRMGVTAGPSGLVVRNLVRDYRLAWRDIVSIDAGKSNNVSGAVTALVIRRADGSSVIGRGASAYSRKAVERWRDELRAVRP